MSAIPWVTDDGLAADDAANTARADSVDLEREVGRAVRRLRVQKAARIRLAAEDTPTRSYEDEYLDRGALSDLPVPAALIEGILPRNAYAILRGRDHSFKSFVAVDWALCAATGTPFMGHQTQQVPVQFIAGEGAHGLAARVDAWESDRGVKVPPEMLTIRRSALNLHQPGPDFDDLLDRVSRGGCGLVIVDTLRRVSGAADGNSSQMGAVVDNLDRIKRATDNGSIVVIAHTDKGDSDSRGFSGIEDDADVVWAAKRKDSLVSLTLAKMKDGPDGISLRMATIPVLESLVLTDAGVIAEYGDKADAIMAFVQQAKTTGASAVEIIENTEVHRPTVYRLLKALTESGHLKKVNTVGKSRYVVSPESQ